MADPRQVERDHEVPGDTPTKSHRTRPALISRVDGSKQHKVREARTLLFQLVAPASCMPEWLIHCVNVLRVYIEQPVVLLVAKGRQRLAQDQAAAAAAAAAARAYGLAAAQGHAGAPSTLGFEHERGLGVPAGLGEAIRWYQRAGARATPMRTFQPRGHACRRQGMPSAQCPAGTIPRPRAAAAWRGVMSAMHAMSTWAWAVPRGWDGPDCAPSPPVVWKPQWRLLAAACELVDGAYVSGSSSI